MLGPITVEVIANGTICRVTEARNSLDLNAEDVADLIERLTNAQQAMADRRNARIES